MTSSTKDNVPCLLSLICKKFSTFDGLYKRYKVYTILLLSPTTFSLTKIDIKFQKNYSTCSYSAHSRTLCIYCSSRRIAIARSKCAPSDDCIDDWREWTDYMRNCEIIPSCKNITRHFAQLCVRTMKHSIEDLLTHTHTYCYLSKLHTRRICSLSIINSDYLDESNNKISSE